MGRWRRLTSPGNQVVDKTGQTGDTGAPGVEHSPAVMAPGERPHIA